jgi:hypothetical protein
LTSADLFSKATQQSKKAAFHFFRKNGIANFFLRFGYISTVATITFSETTDVLAMKRRFYTMQIMLMISAQ